MSPTNPSVLRSDDQASSPLSSNSMLSEFANCGCNYDCGWGCKPSNVQTPNGQPLVEDDDARSGEGDGQGGSIELHSDDETMVDPESMMASIPSVASTGANSHQDRFEAYELWREQVERFRESYLDPPTMMSDAGVTRSNSPNSDNDSMNPEYSVSEGRRTSSSGNTDPRPLSPGGLYLPDLHLTQDPGYKFTNCPLRLSPYNMHCRGNMIPPD